MISIHHCVVQNEAAAACGYEFNISRQPRSQKSFMGQTRTTYYWALNVILKADMLAHLKRTIQRSCHLFAR